MNQEFTIKTEIFEGPLDVLLGLVEKRKLFINDISLAKVTDDFIAYIENMSNVHMRHTADFIVIASTLLLIKSKSLLPNLSFTEEEEKSVEELEDRLKQYKRIKELSLHVKNRFGKQVLFGAQDPAPIVVFSPSPDITMTVIVTAVKNVLASLPKKEKLPEVIVRKIRTLEETIDDLASRIQSALKMSFKDFSKRGSGELSKEEKVNVIVSFLAMLELVKRGIIEASQGDIFDDIEIETHNVGTPNYL
ncbi:MAG: segregation/condensation protein A [Candidatus Paceibacterota bacterium]|jgi:segregation and condensation protein A